VKRGWSPELERLVRRADPVARLIPEVVATTAEDVRERRDEWLEADSLTGLSARYDGGVEITGVEHALVEEAAMVGTAYLTSLGRHVLDSGAVHLARLEWTEGGAYWEPRKIVVQLVAQLDAGAPKEVASWGVQLLWLESHTASSEAQTEPLEYSFYPLHEPVYIPAAGGVNPGPVEVDFALLGIEVRQPLRPPLFTGLNRASAAALPPTGFVHVWALKDDASPAGNVGWAADASRASKTQGGLRLQSFMLVAANGVVGGQAVSQVPALSMYGHTLAEVTVGFTGPDNRIDLGADPGADVELVGQGAQPTGTSVAWEVMADDGTWTAFRDGDLAGVDNRPQGGADLSPTATHPVARRRSYHMRARLIPSATTSPIAGALGARAVERIVLDGEASWQQSGAWAFDPITSAAEVMEGTLRILRTGERDYRDPGTEIFTRYYIAQLSIRLWIGHPALARRLWLLVDSFLVDDYDSHGPEFTVLCISPLAFTRATIPPATQAGPATVRDPLVFANSAIHDVYAALLESAVAVPERYRGSPMPEVPWSVTKRITDADAKSELDALARLAGGAMICSQGRLRFVDVVGVKPLTAVVVREEHREDRISPGLRHRTPEFFVPYLWSEAEGESRFRSLVRSFHVQALERLGTATLDAPRELDHVVARWIDTDELASAAARQVTEAMGPGLMVWSIVTEYAYPELELGDLIAVEAASFAARDLVGGRELKGRVWALGVVQSIGDPWGRQLSIWVRRYADVTVGSEPVDTGGYGAPAEVLSIQKANEGAIARIVSIHNSATARGEAKGEYRVNGGAVESFAIDAAGVGRFDIVRSQVAVSTLQVRGQNSAGLSGPWFAAPIDRYDPPAPPPAPPPPQLTAVHLVVTDTGIGGDDVYAGGLDGVALEGKSVEVRYYRGASLRHTAVISPVTNDSTVSIDWTDVGLGDGTSNQHSVEAELYAGSTAHGSIRSRPVMSLLVA
jgi:hypothetical protein